MDFPLDLDVQALIAPLKEKHGDVVAVMTISGPFVFRGADMKEMAMFEDTNKKSGRIMACKQLCILTVVSVDRMAMGGLIDKKPGIATTCADEILALSGVDASAAVAK